MESYSTFNSGIPPWRPNRSWSNFFIMEECEIDPPLPSMSELYYDCKVATVLSFKNTKFHTPNNRWSQLHDLINKLLFKISYLFDIDVTVRPMAKPGLTTKTEGWDSIILNSNGQVVGYCETQDSNSIRDTLLYLKYVSIIDRPLCFLTNYDAWQICWLDEMDKVNGSKVYQYNDPELVVVLAGVLKTLSVQSKSSDICRVALIHENHDQCDWVTAPDEDLLLNDGKYTDDGYYLLSHLGTGRDGTAYLASSMSGSICVLKFVFGGIEDARLEAENWNKNYKVEVQVFRALEMHAIILPFVYILTDNYMGNRYLQKAASFFIDEVKSRALIGVQHSDPALRHVGFLSIDRPIMIDLALDSTTTF